MGVAQAQLLPGTQLDSDLLKDFGRLHGLDEQGAIDRLAQEESATDLYRLVRSMRPVGYAGAWFEPASGQLVVALSVPAAIKTLQRLGANTTQVRWSLSELDAILSRVLAAAEVDASLNIREAHVDVRSNRVIVAVAAESVARTALRLREGGSGVEVVEAVGEAGFSSGPLRGAVGTRNHTWALDFPPGPYPCSVGVATPGGYLTAGHCGYGGHVVHSPSGLLLGTVGYSTFPYNLANQFDAAWVQTVSGWVPQAQIQGYSDGLLTVPAKWSGTSESPIGATVCRYGQTSGGPHCGTITAKNQTVNMNPGGFTRNIQGLTRVEGSCTEDGDSGGPHLAAGSYQVQGVHVGGYKKIGSTILPSSCPGVPNNVIWFQPIATVSDKVKAGLGGSEKPVVTAHGALAPTVHGLICSQFSPTGYFCTLDYFNSQGVTTPNWSSSQGGSGSGMSYTGNCTTNSWATATVSATNPYGTGAALSRNVFCHAIVP